MHSIEERRRELLNSVILTTKLLFLLFSILSLLPYKHSEILQAMNSGDIILVYRLIFRTAVPILICMAISHLANSKSKEDRELWTWHNTLELAAFLGLLAIILSKGGWYKSYDKFLPLLIILIYSIQFGKQYGYFVAGITSALLLIPTLVLSRGTPEYQAYFQREVALCANLFFIVHIIATFTSVQTDYSDKLKQIANVDGLTGLFNRRYFQEYLSIAINNSTLKKTPLSVILFDIDYFKKFNDTHGHIEGDRLLIELGKLLKEFVGDNGIVARYGGEEFIIVIPNKNEDTVINVAEKLRKEIEETYFEGQETQPNQNVTVSIGVCSYPSIIEDPQKLLVLADEALYCSKEAGRNRVTVYNK